MNKIVLISISVLLLITVIFFIFRNNKLNDTIEGKKTRLVKLNNEIKSLKDNIASMKQNDSNKLNEIIKLNGKVKEQESLYLTIHDQRSILTSKHNYLEEEHDELKDDHNNLKKQHGELQDEHEELQEEHDELKDDHTDLNNKHTGLNKQLGELQDEHGELQEEMDEIEGDKEELDNDFTLATDFFKTKGHFPMTSKASNLISRLFDITEGFSNTDNKSQISKTISQIKKELSNKNKIEHFGAATVWKKKGLSKNDLKDLCEKSGKIFYKGKCGIPNIHENMDVWMKCFTEETKNNDAINNLLSDITSRILDIIKDKDNSETNNCLKFKNDETPKKDNQYISWTVDTLNRKFKSCAMKKLIDKKEDKKHVIHIIKKLLNLELYFNFSDTVAYPSIKFMYKKFMIIFKLILHRFELETLSEEKQIELVRELADTTNIKDGTTLDF